MAHFAKISEENLVLYTTTLDNKNCVDSNGNESESVGQAYLQKHNNWPSHLWIQTSYNTEAGVHRLGGTPFRGNYAGIGYTWDPVNQIFWKPQPFPSWTKDIATASWVSPAGNAPEVTDEMATNLQHYEWDEASLSWIVVTTNA